jgi:hypothetical protein
MEYTLTDSKLRSLKAAVTRAQNRRNWTEVVERCEQAQAVFEKHGYPDCWSDFERHKGDAEVQLRLAAFSGPIFGR